ncbi:MAG: hypothetical protein ACRDHW_06595 [Ktedonobacteraceae bacterium]
MSHITPDDFDPTRPQDTQRTMDNLIDQDPSSSDQPPLTAGEESQATPSQSELAVEEETGTPLSAEEMLPPEARGDVNGGPLGCCLGMTVGLFLSLAVAVLSRFYSDPLSAFFQQNYGLMGVLIRILMGTLAAILAILCGRIGWKLGKRFYREYEPLPVKRGKRRLRSH